LDGALVLGASACASAGFVAVASDGEAALAFVSLAFGVAEEAADAAASPVDPAFVDWASADWALPGWASVDPVVSELAGPVEAPAFEAPVFEAPVFEAPVFEAGAVFA
jgi:monoamine oxidase